MQTAMAKSLETVQRCLRVVLDLDNKRDLLFSQVEGRTRGPAHRVLFDQWPRHVVKTKSEW